MRSRLRSFLRRFWSTIRAGRSDADTRREIAAHLTLLEDDFLRQGLSSEDAHTAACRALGGTERTRALARDAQLFPGLDNARRDVAYAIRTLLRARSFSALTILTLALGVGGATAIYSLAYAALVRPLPVPDTDRILSIREGGDGNAVTYGNFATWRERSREFEALAGWMYGAATLSRFDETTRVSAVRATASTWNVLRLPPTAGRYFSADDDRPGAAPVVVLSHDFWQARFGADPTIVGASILIDAVPRMVVGVAGDGYERMGITNDLWLPLALTPGLIAQHANHELTVYGLVRPGGSIAAARTELQRLEQQLKQEYPKAGLDGIVVTSTLRQAQTGDVAQTVTILIAAVTLVLVLACTNIVNLLLARAAVRQKEFAVRIALGATRGRLITQLVVESAILGCSGAIGGLFVAAWFFGFASAAWPQVARWSSAFDGTSCVIAAVLGVGCSVCIGLIPARRLSATAVQPILRDAGHRPSRVANRTRNVLVLVELSLAVVLVTGAGLLVRTAIALQQVPIGFTPHDRVSLRIALPTGRYREPHAIAAAFSSIVDAAQAIPGVQSAALASRLPFDRGSNCGIAVEGRTGNGGPIANFRTTTGNYFATLGVSVRAGRTFQADDTADAPPVAVINDVLARKLFGSANPLGQRVALCPQMSSRPPRWMEVIGVVSSMRSNGARREMPSELFLPLAQSPLDSTMALVIHSTEPLSVLDRSVRKIVHEIDPFIPVFAVHALDESVAADQAFARWLMQLFVALGALALLIAVIGVYGVVSYFVSQRSHEIGVRMAIGASRAHVAALVLSQGCRLAVVGVAIGTVIALAGTRVLDSLLFGVTSHDELTFFCVVAVLIGVVLLASALPAVRATRLDPVATLRS